jgi:hypothetical protein
MARKRRNRAYIPRREFKFWLRTDREGEAGLIEFIQYAKQTRSFARIVRDGIRLMWSLGQGDTSVLFELFPGLKAQLTPPPAPDTDQLQRQLADLKRLIVEQGSLSAPPVDYPALKPINTGLQPIAGAGRQLSAPIDDDDDEFAGVVIKKSERNNAVTNMMQSLLGIQGKKDLSEVGVEAS